MKVIGMALAIWGLAVSQAVAQDSLLLRDYRFVIQGDPWLNHRNAAALTRFDSGSMARAELSGGKGDGGLVDYDDSRNTLSAAASVESFCRLSQRAVAFGAISYDNWTGRDMTGSAFMQKRLPFNLVEDSLTNTGKKHRDTYRLTGALGVYILKGVALGARMDYTAANYAKYKDLRHQNKLMDMQLTLGAYTSPLNWLHFGADYTYHRRTESVAFGTYGKSERVYKTLIEYGAFMGRAEQFGNEGFTDKAREMPLFEDGHELSVQAEAKASHCLSLFGSIAFSGSDGYYGRKSPFTATYTGHRRNISEAHLAVICQPTTHKSRHRLDIVLQKEKLDNHAETFRELTNQGGANYYEYYDAVETGKKRWHDLSVGLTTLWRIRHQLPTWELAAQYQWHKREQAAYLYPFYRYQLLKTNGLTLTAQRNLLCRVGVWTLALKAAWRDGSGAPFQDGTFSEPDQRQDPPATMEAFLYREYRYMTATRYSVGGSLQYAFVLPKTGMKTYARLGVNYDTTSKGNDYTQGNDHTQVVFAIGCSY